MKCLFIANYVIYNDKANGVAKKIEKQIHSLKNIGVEVDYVFVENGIIKLNKDGKEYCISEQMPAFHKSWDAMLEKLPGFLNTKYDLLYFRLDYISNKMLKFLKYCKKNIAKLCLEIPTLQHKPEPGVRLRTTVAFYLRKLYYKKLYKYIDKIVTFSDDKIIYGISTIQIENCISSDDVEVFNYAPVLNELKLIGVAMMTPSHGFDRVIRGIADYYKNGGKENVTFYIVGDGQVRLQWQKIAEELNMTEHVIFTGKKDGKELDELFSKSNLAVASLAIFRKKCEKCSELKIREYFHRGIPFIYSANEPCIEEFNDRYCKKVAHDESAININEIIAFARSVDYEKAVSEMHQFAIDNFRWESQFKKILKELGFENNENIS